MGIYEAFSFFRLDLLKIQGRRYWAVYYTSPPSFHNKIFLFVALTTLGTLIKF